MCTACGRRGRCMVFASTKSKCNADRREHSMPNYSQRDVPRLRNARSEALGSMPTTVSSHRKHDVVAGFVKESSTARATWNCWHGIRMLSYWNYSCRIYIHCRDVPWHSSRTLTELEVGVTAIHHFMLSKLLWSLRYNILEIWSLSGVCFTIVMSIP